MLKKLRVCLINIQQNLFVIYQYFRHKKTPKERLGVLIYKRLGLKFTFCCFTGFAINVCYLID